MNLNVLTKSVQIIIVILMTSFYHKISAQTLREVSTLTSPTLKSIKAFDLGGYKNFDFIVGNWSGRITVGEKCITIDTETNGTNGAAGFHFSPINLSKYSPDKVFLAIRARLLRTHNGSHIRLALGTNPKDFTVWDIDVDRFDKDMFKTVLIPLNTIPVYIGGNGVNLAQVTNIQVVGDYFGNSDFDIEVESIEIMVQEPNLAQVP